MSTNDVEWDVMSLSELFIECYRLFHQLVLYDNDSNDSNDDKIIKASRILELTIRKVDEASLFSKNEDFDDYANDSLKYLFLTYFLGKICSKYMHIKDRRQHLIHAKRSLNNYIEICKKFNIINDDDKMFIDTDNNNNTTTMNDNTRRTLKIAKFKREKEAKESMKALLIKMNIEAKRVPDYESIEALDDDEDTKQLLLLQFQSYIRDAIDEIVLINQEINLLDHMSELKELEDEFGSKQNKGPPPKSSIEITTEIGKANVSYLPSRDYPDQRDEKGLSITRLDKIDDQLIVTRDNIKANVFTPSMAPPTISLEEFADMEKEKALARSAKESNESSDITRRYNQLVKDGDEDDNTLVDLATIEDRNWDDFKEANPRGWGNKMGKRF